MPTKVVNASVFDVGANAVVNPINQLAISGCGLALEFKKRFPSNQKLIQEAAKQKHLKLGKVYLVHRSMLDETLPKYFNFILNIPTKEKPSRTEKTKLTTVDSAIESIKKLCVLWFPQTEEYKIAIPLLGCGAGKLVKQKLVDGLDELKQTILICEI